MTYAFDFPKASGEIRFRNIIFGHYGGKQLGRFKNQFFLPKELLLVDIKEIFRNVHFVIPVLPTVSCMPSYSFLMRFERSMSAGLRSSRFFLTPCVKTSWRPFW